MSRNRFLDLSSPETRGMDKHRSTLMKSYKTKGLQSNSQMCLMSTLPEGVGTLVSL